MTDQILYNSKPDSTNFEILVHKSRISDNFSFSTFFHKLVKIKNLENGTALMIQRKLDVYKK